ncbi:hypothetical protein I6E17_08180 [Fusobacterium perfoetens]|uniref:DUF1302 domain-containing protein n=1 Tax=Fusobacterium perfoetens TaxID=852 RepID=UPI001F3ABA5B|nr:DUF1302 domain-containing protein [Fusobacterium perfoetens]MCF2626133.1 hypothetical protein [Fusobacterium perfoetens]
MKKLALLLGALSLVSSVAYAKEVVPAVEEVVVVEEAAPVAAPALTVTNIGQYIEVDNTSGGADIGEKVHFANVVGLAYEDWTFGLMARKAWSMDTDDGIHSNGHRMELDFWKNYENFSVGAIWRGESDSDRYLARVKYNYGMFSGNLMAGYKFMNNDANDYFYAEGMPVAVSYGPVKVGYYFEYSKYNGTSDKPKGKDGWDMKEEALHQVRVFFPIYNGEKLSLDGQYRYQFAHDQEYVKKQGWDENNRHIAILGANYALTDNLSINGYYQYEWNKYEAHDKKEAKHDDYYGEFCVGWTYSF